VKVFMEVFFKKLAPYAPVHPPEALAARAGLEVGQLIKIDANENPFGAPQCVDKAIHDAFGLLSIYPGER
jgi:histidinol-phosphate/aromatic aminotransferase/cobyric acid decarboxylase-like protein